MLDRMKDNFKGIRESSHYKILFNDAKPHWLIVERMAIPTGECSEFEYWHILKRTEDGFN